VGERVLRHAQALAAGVAQPAAAPARPARAGGASPSWDALQAEFFGRLVERRSADADALVDDDRPVPAARGMRVYGDAYAASLPRALAVNFPALAKVLDPDDWSALCAAYLERHPPRGHDFRSLGSALAGFTRSFAFRGSYGVDPSVLAELVALEQAQLEVQDGSTIATLAPSALAALTLRSGRMPRFVCALRVVRATHEVLPVVEAVARGETPARPKAAITSYLVCRTASGLQTLPIPERDAEILGSLIAGRSFAEACDAAAALEGADLAEIALGAVRVLVHACERGLIL
jgi:hypothetical protein